MQAASAAAAAELAKASGGKGTGAGARRRERLRCCSQRSERGARARSRLRRVAQEASQGNSRSRAQGRQLRLATPAAEEDPGKAKQALIVSSVRISSRPSARTAASTTWPRRRSSRQVAGAELPRETPRTQLGGHDHRPGGHQQEAPGGADKLHHLPPRFARCCVARASWTRARSTRTRRRYT